MSHLPPEQSAQSDRDRDLDLDRNDDRDRRDDRGGLRDDDRPATSAVAATDAKQQRHDLKAKQEDRFGGMRFFLAFFGWLTATGVVVLLTAVATGVGALVAGQDATANADNVLTTGLVGVIVLGVVLLVAYYCGGYVAGRMARFNGLKQGVAVWLWAIVIVVLATIAGLVVGSSTDVFAQLGGIPSLPVDGSTATAAGIGAIVGALVVSLVGAILGGLAGMRFHRKVDRFAAEQR